MFLVLQHIECEYLGTIEDYMRSRDMDYKYINLYAREDVPVDRLDEYEGIIVLGGPMNVYEEDKYPFLKDEDILLKKAIEKDMPVLGICLGAQLLAKAMGAKVTRGQKKEIGWYELNITEEGKRDRIFKEFPETMTVFQWHGDTFEIPHGASWLASSALFPHQAFRIKNNIYGLQFHLEVTEEMIREWVDEYKEEISLLPYIDPGKILEDTPLHIQTLHAFANKFYSHFFR